MQINAVPINNVLLRDQDDRLRSACQEIEQASQRILTQLSDAESANPEEAELALDAAAYVIWRVDQGMHELIDLHQAVSDRLDPPRRLPR